MDQFAGADETGAFDDAGRSVRSSTTPTIHYVNESGLADELIMDDIRENRDIANQIERWTQSLALNGHSDQKLDIFGRKTWNGVGHVFATFAKCSWAVKHDDILSTLADVTEGLMFNRCSFEMNDDDQEDIWNQWAADIDLDARLREMARELYKVSQVYVGLWWERRTYTVRTDSTADIKKVVEDVQAEKQAAAGLPVDPVDKPKGGNRKRRKQFTLEIPTEITIFDPTKILPVGNLLFGRERFAYIASNSEDQAFVSVMKGDQIDPLVLRMIDQKYTPTEEEVHLCEELGVDPGRLWLFRPGTVFRHALTKAHYERFAAVRLEPAMEIIDLKHDLRGSDKSSLVGNANFIIVITKGSDKYPAKPGEIDNLKEQSRVVAKMPVLVGDHRLNVEIVSPTIDNTLIESRWQVLDSRLVFMALRSFQPIVQGGNASGGVSEMSRVVSQGLENRRGQLVRALERGIFTIVMDRNLEQLDERPTVAFLPKHVSLDFKADIMTAILKLRDRGDISRETTLEELDFDQEVEARRRAKEIEFFDPVFQSGTPFSSPQMNPYGVNDPNAPEDPNAPKPEKKASDTGRPPGVVEEEPRAPKTRKA